MPNKFNYISSKSANEFLQSKNLLYEEDISQMNFPEEVLSLVAQDVVKKYQILPVRLKDNTLIIFTVFENMSISREIKEALKTNTRTKNYNVDIIYVQFNLKRIIEEKYNVRFDNLKRVVDTTIDNTDLPAVRIKMTNMINIAIERDVSDIHLLPTEGGVIVNFRINGRLIDVSEEFKFAEDQRHTIVNIVKNFDTSGQVNQSNSLIESNGSFEYSYRGVVVNIRISTIPTAQGFESVALRLLVRKNNKRMLDDLGYNPKDINSIRTVNKACANGLILIAGPTGAGKSTLNYALIYDDVKNALINYDERKYVMTIENPVEIFEPTFCQVQERLTPENPKLNFDAVRILESFLRHDPDIIIYGEIRSKEDADVATKAGQTGHKVYATVHANDCVTTILRLLDLGVARVSLLEQIRIIMSQRLIKILCPDCSREYTLTEQDKILLSPKEYDELSHCYLRTIGKSENVAACPTCKGLGYINRIPILEYIIFNDELRDMFMDTAVKYTNIDNILQKYRFTGMWNKALEYVKKGYVDLGEAISNVGNKTAINNIISNMYKK